MRKYTIDLNEVFNADELQRAIRKVLPLPEHYGNNLDALYDVMTEWTEDTSITFLNVDEAEVTMPKHMKALRRMCRDVQEENPTDENERITNPLLCGG